MLSSLVRPLRPRCVASALPSLRFYSTPSDGSHASFQRQPNPNKDTVSEVLSRLFVCSSSQRAEQFRVFAENSRPVAGYNAPEDVVGALHDAVDVLFSASNEEDIAVCEVVTAPQIHLQWRAVLLSGEGEKNRTRQLLCDPLVTYRSGDTVTTWEPCVSFPGLLFRTRRAKEISLSFWTDTPEERTTLAMVNGRRGFALQRGCDALEGRLVSSRVEGGDGGDAEGNVVPYKAFLEQKDRYNNTVDVPYL